MESLSENLRQQKIHQEAMAIEKVYFTKTDRAVNPRKENPFKHIMGNIPILVSAPHAVRHMRQKKIKQSDIYTGSMACLLNQLTGCHTLSVVRLYGGDPNYDLPCLYKDLLAEICTVNKISFVIDIHGASADNNFDIDIGTMHGTSLLNKSQLEQIISENMHMSGISNLSQNIMPAAKQNTVTKFAANVLGIPSVQLEINRKFRAPNQNPVAYCRMIAALITIINQSNQYLHGRN